MTKKSIQNTKVCILVLFALLSFILIQTNASAWNYTYQYRTGKAVSMKQTQENTIRKNMGN
ncbi:MAG: hypothetical protein OIN87_01715 [Candidatus Methanoperedens sp.]|nr:hypothetical protein [Candidatus Methanoperedens sp.]